MVGGNAVLSGSLSTSSRDLTLRADALLAAAAVLVGAARRAMPRHPGWCLGRRGEARAVPCAAARRRAERIPLDLIACVLAHLSRHRPARLHALHAQVVFAYPRIPPHMISPCLRWETDPPHAAPIPAVPRVAVVGYLHLDVGGRRGAGRVTPQ